MLLGSLVINYFAGTYATTRASNAVTDLVLNNIPVFDVDGIFVYGAIILWIFLIFIIIQKPHYIPFTLKSVSLFVIIRSLFVTLTHIGPFPTQIVISASYILNKLTFGGDLFFSGHTGLPFLFYLIFWHIKPLRYIFLSASIIFGVVVLLGHLHYSIDVLGAFFITYTIFHMAELLFPFERSLLFTGIQETE